MNSIQILIYALMFFSIYMLWKTVTGLNLRVTKLEKPEKGKPVVKAPSPVREEKPELARPSGVGVIVNEETKTYEWNR